MTTKQENSEDGSAIPATTDSQTSGIPQSDWQKRHAISKPQGGDAVLRREDPLVRLVTDLQTWMVSRPEWLLIVAMPRQQRRAAMKELANRLYTIPIMDGLNTVPRQVRRKASKQLARAALTGELTEQVKEALAKAAQETVELVSAEFDAEARAWPETPLESLPEAPEVVTPAGEPFSIADPAEDLLPDPEGDAKANLYPEK